MEDNEPYPKPGDLIEIKKPLYDHWALYVGDGFVIHVTPVDREASSSCSSSASVKSNKAVVRKQLFKEVVENEVWLVNNKYDYCWTPLPVEKIIQHAESWVNKEWTYGLVKNNCEHFVTMLRYGEGFSDQVWKAFVRGISVIGTGATVGASVAIGVAAVATGVVAGTITTGGVGLVTLCARVAEYCKSKASQKRKNN